MKKKQFKATNAKGANLRQAKMRHIRNIKPEFFEHLGVNKLSIEAAYLWIGVWTCSDKYGRFEWSPEMLKHYLVPFRNNITPADVDKFLDELVAAGFIEKYTVANVVYGRNLTWESHQPINIREKRSTFAFPEPPDNSTASTHVQAHANTSRYGFGYGVGYTNRYASTNTNENGFTNDDETEKPSPSQPINSKPKSTPQVNPRSLTVAVDNKKKYTNEDYNLFFSHSSPACAYTDELKSHAGVLISTAKSIDKFLPQTWQDLHDILIAADIPSLSAVTNKVKMSIPPIYAMETAI